MRQIRTAAYADSLLAVLLSRGLQAAQSPQQPPYDRLVGVLGGWRGFRVLKLTTSPKVTNEDYR